MITFPRLLAKNDKGEFFSIVAYLDDGDLWVEVRPNENKPNLKTPPIRTEVIHAGLLLEMFDKCGLKRFRVGSEWHDIDNAKEK